MIPIHIINLPHRTDRKEKLLSELKRHKVENYVFADAVNGADLDIEAMVARGDVDFSHRQLKRGEYGCYLSHLNVYKKILDSDEEVHLILEDDVYFVPGFVKKLNRILDVEDEWDIFYLGYNPISDDFREGEFITKDVYRPKNMFYGTHAYIIKKKTIEKVMHLLMPIVLPIDVYLSSLGLKTLASRNRIIKAYGIDSDTQGII